MTFCGSLLTWGRGSKTTLNSDKKSFLREPNFSFKASTSIQSLIIAAIFKGFTNSGVPFPFFRCSLHTTINSCSIAFFSFFTSPTDITGSLNFLFLIIKGGFNKSKLHSFIYGSMSVKVHNNMVFN
jgi:hypothetical protein